jgi:hypothetical protein
MKTSSSRLSLLAGLIATLGLLALSGCAAPVEGGEPGEEVPQVAPGQVKSESAVKCTVDDSSLQCLCQERYAACEHYCSSQPVIARARCNASCERSYTTCIGAT